MIHAGGVGGGSASVVGQILGNWAFPGDLNVNENNYIPRRSWPAAVMIAYLKLKVRTAPTGQKIIVTLKKGNIATGALTATLGTAEIAINAFDTTALTGVINAAIATTEFVVIEITQVGNVVAGETLSADLIAA